MTEKINVAVVGVGFFGERHAQIYSELSNVSLVAVVDSDRARALTVAERFGCEAFCDLQPLFGRIRAASIATPANQHAQVACPLLQQGIDLLIEKPMAATLEEADRINQLAQQQRAIVQVGHIERFNPAFLSFQTHVFSPLHIVCQRMGPFLPRAANISVVLDLMIHDIDLVLSLVASDPVKIEAAGLSVVSPQMDIAHARLVFEGVTAHLMASRVSPQRLRTLHVFEKERYLFLDLLQREGFVLSKPLGEAAGVKEALQPISMPAVDPLKEELLSFLEAVQTRRSPRVSGKEGRAALSVALQIMEKIEATVAPLPPISLSQGRVHAPI